MFSLRSCLAWFYEETFRWGLLAPWDGLKSAENNLDYTSRLVVTEEIKDLPYAVVWAEFCERMGVPSGQSLVSDLYRYQSGVAGRG
ncbi:L-rhamnose isomerase [Thalassobacter sp. 16PALIMAR09]|uniref:L-rhamnose isomerase n=1 Tax=Thalassobacter sp. 16PALIMAR09 TaxID=1225651 RepID=UPI00051D1362|nr:L-rhamnose isomerase [Thalassobacter sp. 16PALIMAR09]KGL03139.1 hypothetical protein PM04_01915 [Thalassobacter sp. 16PALIMAR09]